MPDGTPPDGMPCFTVTILQAHFVRSHGLSHTSIHDASVPDFQCTKTNHVNRPSQPNTKTVGDKQYHWCSTHQSWGEHEPQDCRKAKKQANQTFKQEKDIAHVAEEQEDEQTEIQNNDDITNESEDEDLLDSLVDILNDEI